MCRVYGEEEIKAECEHNTLHLAILSNAIRLVFVLIFKNNYL